MVERHCGYEFTEYFCHHDTFVQKRPDYRLTRKVYICTRLKRQTAALRLCLDESQLSKAEGYICLDGCPKCILGCMMGAHDGDTVRPLPSGLLHSKPRSALLYVSAYNLDDFFLRPATPVTSCPASKKSGYLKWALPIPEVCHWPPSTRITSVLSVRRSWTGSHLPTMVSPFT